MSERTTGKIEIINKLGLHTRPAAELVKVANKFKSEITLQFKGQEANGKSILGVLTLAAGMGSKITVTAEGPDHDAAFTAIKKLIESGFHER